MEVSRAGGSCVIRSARRGEAPAVVALWRALPDVLPSVSDDEASVRVLLERDAAALVVADVAGRIVGTVIVGWDGWRGNLYRLAVDSAHRRRGVASGLVGEAERRLRAAGARRIAASVTVTEDHAVGFWRTAGYTVAEDSRRFVKTLAPGRGR